ncbi:MAG: 4Fe-4S dicluster domain-containing protein [Candidatus Brocadiia bacterium]
MATIDRRVLLDLDRCIDCKSCSAACFYGHRGMPNVAFASTAEAAVPMVCRQCEDPPCVAACPFDALRREEDGAVVRSLVFCRGCGSCILACPFGVMDTDLTRDQVAKCDLCEDRALRGEVPRCVAACPAGALQFEPPAEAGEVGLLLLGGRTAGRHPFKRR